MTGIKVFFEPITLCSYTNTHRKKCWKKRILFHQRFATHTFIDATTAKAFRIVFQFDVVISFGCSVSYTLAWCGSSGDRLRELRKSWNRWKKRNKPKRESKNINRIGCAREWKGCYTQNWWNNNTKIKNDRRKNRPLWGERNVHSLLLLIFDVGLAEHKVN